MTTVGNKISQNSINLSSQFVDTQGDSRPPAGSATNLERQSLNFSRDAQGLSGITRRGNKTPAPKEGELEFLYCQDGDREKPCYYDVSGSEEEVNQKWRKAPGYKTEHKSDWRAMNCFKPKGSKKADCR